jgi:hypothetical protein
MFTEGTEGQRLASKTILIIHKVCLQSYTTYVYNHTQDMFTIIHQKFYRGN